MSLDTRSCLPGAMLRTTAALLLSATLPAHAAPPANSPLHQFGRDRPLPRRQPGCFARSGPAGEREPGCRDLGADTRRAWRPCPGQAASALLGSRLHTVQPRLDAGQPAPRVRPAAVADRAAAPSMACVRTAAAWCGCCRSRAPCRICATGPDGALAVLATAQRAQGAGRDPGRSEAGRRDRRAAGRAAHRHHRRRRGALAIAGRALCLPVRLAAARDASAGVRRHRVARQRRRQLVDRRLYDFSDGTERLLYAPPQRQQLARSGGVRRWQQGRLHRRHHERFRLDTVATPSCCRSTIRRNPRTLPRAPPPPSPRCPGHAGRIWSGAAWPGRQRRCLP